MSAAPKLDSLVDSQESSVTEYATKGVRKSARTNLRLVSPMRVQKASRGIFIVVLLGILSLGGVAVLVINTTLAQGAFTLSELRSQQAELSRTEATLTEEVAALAAPTSLEQQARVLGMVPSSAPAFIRVTDGKVLGKPKAAQGAKIATPADATVSEAVTDPALADLPEAPGVGYDPAAADAMANEQQQNGVVGAKGKKAKAGVDQWTEPTVIKAEVISEDALLDAVPVQ